MAHVAAVILAAGMAKRYRAADASTSSKVIADLDGRPLVRHVIDAALCSRAAPVVVVTGHAGDAVRAALIDADVAFVDNPDFATGLASSLKCGIERLPSDNQGVIVLLADMPKVTTALLNRLIEALVAHPQADAIVPVRDGVRGNPVLLAKKLFPRVMELKGDHGARPLLEATDVAVIEVSVDDDSISADVDTPEALQALRAG